MTDRRTKEGYKLRVYIDAIREARAMSDEQWINEFVSSKTKEPYFSRLTWIAYLEKCALIEAERFLKRLIA